MTTLATTTVPGTDMSGGAAPGTPIASCTHQRVTHVHGTRVGYIVCRCRCAHCRSANRTYENNRSRQQLYRRPARLVDAGPVRAHIRALMDQGMGWKRVANQAGVARTTVGGLLYGKHPDEPDHPDHRPPRARVSRDVADKLLAVTVDLAPCALIPQAGTVRRVQALVACGWPQAILARHIGWTPANFGGLVHGKRGQVTVATAELVRKVYDELWDQPPPAATRWQRSARTRALSVAREYGWAPPMAYDDETIDDPFAEPDSAHTNRQVGVDLDEVVWLLDGGTNPTNIAARMGTTVDAIIRAAHRAERRDLAARVHRQKVA